MARGVETRVAANERFILKTNAAAAESICRIHLAAKVSGRSGCLQAIQTARGATVETAFGGRRLAVRYIAGRAWRAAAQIAAPWIAARTGPTGNSTDHLCRGRRFTKRFDFLRDFWPTGKSSERWPNLFRDKILYTLKFQ